ncbi:hypothetical protein H6G97_03450 [Nostoc flagelliforme FACHB-838]|uniref:Transposase n=1 Tax=Nostoc flagelliforme FACHB-838 TaxID=2692904 RepID=A0ABR8DH04_9NOSO|nr:hypothetical protein [Nostoc flagelliforme]MBD2528666.1 hypothetical protein [Nostoc flagelliforme FACHB-838]
MTSQEYRICYKSEIRRSHFKKKQAIAIFNEPQRRREHRRRCLRRALPKHFKKKQAIAFLSHAIGTLD